LVERSGQGVDKIYSITLSEGKAEPDYKSSDMFQVSLVLKTEIINKAFHIFVSQYQNSDREPKLGVEQIITLYKINNGLLQGLNPEIVEQLDRIGLIVKLSGHTHKYTLSKEYQELAKEELTIGNYIVKEVESLLLAIQGRVVKINDLKDLLKDTLSRNQIKYLVGKLVDEEILKSEGQLRGTRYSLTKDFENLRADLLTNSVLEYLRNKYN